MGNKVLEKRHMNKDGRIDTKKERFTDGEEGNRPKNDKKRTCKQGIW